MVNNSVCQVQIGKQPLPPPQGGIASPEVRTRCAREALDLAEQKLISKQCTHTGYVLSVKPNCQVNVQLTDVKHLPVTRFANHHEKGFGFRSFKGMASTPGPWVAAGESSTLPMRLLQHQGTRVPWATSKPSWRHRVSPLQQRQCPHGTLAATTRWQRHCRWWWWWRWHWQPGAWPSWH